jgi:molybdopterin converting factor small subunit
VSEPDVVEVHLFAAARAAAGAPRVEVAAGSLAEVLEQLVAQAPDLAGVLPRCSYLLDEVAVRPSELDREIPAGSRLDVLPPFAGG